MKTYRYILGQTRDEITEGGKLVNKRIWSIENSIDAESLVQAYGSIVLLMADKGYQNYIDYNFFYLQEVI